MCDIRQITQHKQVTVYKAVMKSLTSDKECYYSPFAGTDLLLLGRAPESRHNFGHHHNNNMVGRVSGFKNIEPAFALLKECSRANVVLRMVLEATERVPIMQGTSARIASGIDWGFVTYAGPVVVSMEEVDEQGEVSNTGKTWITLATINTGK
jgi:hypothetical protein